MTIELTEAGRRLADALVRADALSWNAATNDLWAPHLNTAAALLFTQPEDEGAGLREADAEKWSVASCFLHTAESSAAWMDSAAMFSRNADFYRGIVVQIGEMFGDAAKTSDDGSLQDSVLALKVPDLVAAALTKQPAAQEPSAAGVEWFLPESHPHDEKPVRLKLKDGQIVAGYWGQSAKAFGGAPGYPWVILDETNGTSWLAESQVTGWLPLALTPATPKTPDAGAGEPQADLSRIQRIERQMHQHGGVDSDDMAWMAARIRTALAQPAPVGEDETGVRA